MFHWWCPFKQWPCDLYSKNRFLNFVVARGMVFHKHIWLILMKVKLEIGNQLKLDHYSLPLFTIIETTLNVRIYFTHKKSYNISGHVLSILCPTYNVDLFSSNILFASNNLKEYTNFLWTYSPLALGRVIFPIKLVIERDAGYRDCVDVNK